MLKTKQDAGIMESRWILEHIINYPRGKILDFGSGPNIELGRKLVQIDFKVVCIDLLPIKYPLSSKPITNLTYIQDNILNVNLPDASFDFITSNSSIEHAGLGRYDEKEELDQDLKIMQLFKRILKPSGRIFLTIPVGIDAVIEYYHRVYGKERLPRLLMNWEILAEEYWKKGNNNVWCQTNNKEALDEKPTGPARPRYYALGFFELKVK